jgi:hypothetical protein
LALLLTLAASRPAPAHDLGAECTLRGDRVEVEAYYDDDTPAGDARVRVLGAGGEAVALGRTDARGRWSFPRPSPGGYRVLVDAGGGHSTTVKITVTSDPKAEPQTARTPSDACDCCRDEAPTPAAVVVSAGPGLAEFTRTRWPRAAAGVGVVALLGLGWWGARRLGGASGVERPA